MGRLKCGSKTFCKQLYREMLAEFFGTFILVVITVAAGLQSGLSRGAYGSFLANVICCGLAVMMAVHVSGKVSGGHVNPVVSLTMAVVGKFSWFKVPFFMLAQYCGAFVASAVAYGVYGGALYAYNGNHHDLITAAMWTSFPASNLSFGYSFVDLMSSTGLLLFMILALTDKKNMGFWTGFSPFFLGLLVMCIIFGFSLNAACPMNPARDLGPRLFLSISGWGTAVFKGPNYTWWWIPIVAPHLGGIIGALIYEGLIEFHHPDEEEQRLPKPTSQTPRTLTPKEAKLHETESLIPSVAVATPPFASVSFSTSSSSTNF